jgi:hypothetical protein
VPYYSQAPFDLGAEPVVTVYPEMELTFAFATGGAATCQLFGFRECVS